MSDETQSGAKFFGTTLKTVEGDIQSPASARMLVDVEAPGMGFVEIEIIAIEEQAFMKFSRDAPWLPLPLEQVPFNFGGMGLTLSALLPVLQDPTVVGRESVGDFQTIRVDGNVMSEDMSNLITSVDPGHAITLSYWFDENGHTLRQLRIDGQLFNDDAPETSRLVNMDIDVPVDIQLPEVASGS
ncbi:MAG: LppX_LprAFG lipoprotein [Chloroflexi bacterium]|nr:LppX_LprAFG lipoprotein [Chloroflexota bacterium]